LAIKKKPQDAYEKAWATFLNPQDAYEKTWATNVPKNVQFMKKPK
jgi:hypothetical protein